MTRGERVQRYAEAILDNFHGPDATHSTWWLNTDEMGIAVMAVADAEQDALRAKVARVEALAAAHDREIPGSAIAASIRAALSGTSPC